MDPRNSVRDNGRLNGHCGHYTTRVLPMNSDAYHLVTVTDGRSDSAAIIEVFSDMAEGRLTNDLRLLNYYNEVPVSFGTTITRVDRDRIEVIVHEHQALIIDHARGTLITSKHFHNGLLGVHCRASRVHVTQRTAILYNFAYAMIRAERREVVRVRVNEMRPVKFSYDNAAIEGAMVDISGNGMAIRTGPIPTMESCQTGILSFTLGDTPLELPASLIRCTMDAEDSRLCMFKMESNNRSDSVISRFIFRRQAEIILELKEGKVLE